MPRVSVIIPVYNAERFISETIESVTAQTYEDWEIIAVDDGSRDRSLEILKEYSKRYSRIRVISQKNAGSSAARNNAIRVSRGEYIAFLDHDDLWLPDKLEKQVRILDSNKKLGMVYSDSRIIDAEGNTKRNTMVHGRFFRGNIFNKLIEYDFIPLLTVVVRRGVLDKTGMFNPRFKTSEDYDLLLRIAEHYPADFIKQALTKYRVHSEAFSRNVELTAREDLQIMEYWLNRKPGIVRPLIRKRHACLYFRAGWAFYKQGRFKQSIRYYKKAIRASPLYYKTYIALPFSFLRTRILMRIINTAGFCPVRF